ncbi:MAG: acyl carrier protein [Nonomuraea sp.]|nr:acyl carrier protein [Nonomuraea sp.]NUP62561.1 acyl carrier protein [Nonomuraea sp.]NUP79640.1 acyl carrier protein [Nonomuraea sp.]NUS03432.1 acyl carrier protein [Nonomuraea sp.]NUT39004.1 acyl carrier protein [Thermoactinospora sp.]
MRDADPADVDRHVTDIWNTVLAVGPGEADATFGELGGTALAALRMAAQIEDRLGVAIAPVTLLHDGTLGALLGRVRAEHAGRCGP